MSDAVWLAIGLALVFEGTGPLLFPGRWAEYMKKMAAEGPGNLRRIGGVLVVIGMVIIAQFG